ncbi:MAG TPA: hypothetical protein VM326_02340 [Sphingomicrobium sp.]|nr:hypothetical protein [Sphingomicrobium sp.]
MADQKPPRPRWRYRCAISGELLSKAEYDRRDPKTTVRERVK